jgi:hypothetical protein
MVQEKVLNRIQVIEHKHEVQPFSNEAVGTIGSLPVMLSLGCTSSPAYGITRKKFVLRVQQCVQEDLLSSSSPGLKLLPGVVMTTNTCI